MAFLRSICAQRATSNLVYSRNKSNRSATSVWRSSGEATATASISTSSSLGSTNQQEVCHVSDRKSDDLKYSAVLQSQISQRQPQQHQLLSSILFSPAYNSRHTLFTKGPLDRSVVAARQEAEPEVKRTRSHKPPQQQPNVPANPQRDPLDVSFNDPIASFKSKTTWELIRAYLVYTVCSIEPVVENNLKVN